MLRCHGASGASTSSSNRFVFLNRTHGTRTVYPAPSALSASRAVLALTSNRSSIAWGPPARVTTAHATASFDKFSERSIDILGTARMKAKWLGYASVRSWCTSNFFLLRGCSQAPHYLAFRAGWHRAFVFGIGCCRAREAGLIRANCGVENSRGSALKDVADAAGLEFSWHNGLTLHQECN